MAQTIVKFTAADLREMAQRYRTQLINSVTGYKSVSLIGTKNKQGIENLAVFNSIVHIGANPPLIGMISRPDSVDRHTLTNIRETGHYTINHISGEWVDRAHQTSARYPEHISEFEAVGLTASYHNDFPAPYVKESAIKLGMKLVEELSIASNGTTMIIGEVLSLTLPEACLGNDGFVDLRKAGTSAGSGLDAYHTVTELKRLSYAKPDQQPEFIITEK